jgi:integrase
MSGPKRRSPGEGGAYPYRTNAGVRWCWKAVLEQPDGTHKPVMRRRGPDGEEFPTRKAALTAMRQAQAEAHKGVFAGAPSRQSVSAHIATWLDGLRLRPSTVASYRIIMRLHVEPYIGRLPLASVTSTRLDALYRQLERGGRRDTKGELTGRGLSYSTVKYVSIVLRAALQAAVDAGMLPRNPAVKAHPPTAAQAQAPEMQCWTESQLDAFLSWAREHSPGHYVAWRTLATTGMRRGELLALRWKDVDLDAKAISVRRSAVMIRYKGESSEIREGPTKTYMARVVNIGEETAAALRSWRRERGSMALTLARDDSPVFGTLENGLRNPEHFSGAFKGAVRRFRKWQEAAGAEAAPYIRLHDLRHTHASILLSKGMSVRTVSARLGHRNATTTMNIYAHVMPGDQKAAAELTDLAAGDLK